MKNFFLLVLIGSATIFSQEFKEELLVHQNDTLPYRILLPKNYNSQKFFQEYKSQIYKKNYSEQCG